MTTEILPLRPAVISDETREALDEYRGFRHVVHNVYTFKFDPLKVGVFSGACRVVGLC
jgi:hypothetical protein